MKLILFDIDGTMLLSGGAAIRAVNRAFEKLFRMKEAMDGIRADGKTDPIILREIFNKNLRRDFLPEESKSIYEAYVIYLEEEIANSPGFTVMPGIAGLLKTLSGQDGLALGIATGNVEAGARIKLARAGLDSYFRFGGFGSDSEDRKRIILIAAERGKAYFKREFDEVFVVGDTPMDIIHGREAGAITVGVATGSYSLGDLEKHRPDYLFSDLSDNDGVLKAFRIAPEDRGEIT